MNRSSGLHVNRPEKVWCSSTAHWECPRVHLPFQRRSKRAQPASNHTRRRTLENLVLSWPFVVKTGAWLPGGRGSLAMEYCWTHCTVATDFSEAQILELELRRGG